MRCSAGHGVLARLTVKETMRISPTLALVISVLVAVANAGALTVHPREFGAVGDGRQLDTQAIQAALDRCAAQGGGTVLLEGGTFLSGTLYLRSHVTLQIAAGATLLGSTNVADYPHHIPKVRSYTDNYVKQSLLIGEDLENVALVGDGLIDGQGASFIRNRERPYENRPYLIRLIHCRDVRVEGLRLQNSAMWMQHYLACERVTVRGIRVWNFSNANNDGIDLDGSRDCLVSQCVFESDDDGITLKSTLDRPTESVTISDCIARSHCNAIKLGTESNGGFKNISIANCVVTSPLSTNAIYGHGRGLSGISLEMVDGGRLERVAIANIVMQGVTVPLFLRLGDRARRFSEGQTMPPIGTFRSVVIQNIVASEMGRVGCSITGLPGHPVEDIQLNNLTFTFDGGGDPKRTHMPVPELPQKYPECTMFGELPAFGFYVRHARGISFANVQLRTAEREERHAMLFDDVEKLSLDAFDATYAHGGASMLRLCNVRDVLIRGCQPRAPVGTFLQLSGRSSRRVHLLANDLSAVGRRVELARDVPARTVSIR